MRSSSDKPTHFHVVIHPSHENSWPQWACKSLFFNEWPKIRKHHSKTPFIGESLIHFLLKHPASKMTLVKNSTSNIRRQAVASPGQGMGLCRGSIPRAIPGILHFGGQGQGELHWCQQGQRGQVGAWSHEAADDPGGQPIFYGKKNRIWYDQRLFNVSGLSSKTNLTYFSMVWS